MICNVAFYDEKRRKLVNYEQMAFDRSQAPLAAISMGLMWRSGQHHIPSRCWVVWNHPDDVGVFFLDQVDSIDVSSPSKHLLDHIHSCVVGLAAGQSH